MSVYIKEITTKADKKRFLKFYQKLYWNNEFHAPPLYIEDMAEFDPKQNSIFDQCQCRMFLAYRGKKIVGRIAGLIHTRVNDKYNSKELRFTRFDAIDDIEVTRALFDTLINWAKQAGMTQIVGPMSFTDICEEGMLIEGFDQQSMYADSYNASYYVDHLNQLGAHKVVDWLCYRIDVPTQMDTRVEKLSLLLQKKYGYSVLDIKNTPKKKLLEYMNGAMDVVNEAFANIHGTSMLDDMQKKALCDKVMAILHPDIVTIVLHQDKVIGYGLLCPNLNKVLRKAHGSLLRALPQFIHATSHVGQVVDMMSIGVLDEHLKRGVPAIIMHNTLKGLIANGTQYLETGRELEDNHDVQNLWKNYNKIQNRKYRCWAIDVPTQQD